MLIDDNCITKCKDDVYKLGSFPSYSPHCSTSLNGSVQFQRTTATGVQLSLFPGKPPPTPKPGYTRNCWAIETGGVLHPFKVVHIPTTFHLPGSFEWEEAVEILDRLPAKIQVNADRRVDCGLEIIHQVDAVLERFRPFPDNDEEGENNG